jgi:hypothetical protein
MVAKIVPAFPATSRFKFHDYMVAKIVPAFPATSRFKFHEYMVAKIVPAFPATKIIKREVHEIIIDLDFIVVYSILATISYRFAHQYSVVLGFDFTMIGHTSIVYRVSIWGKEQSQHQLLLPAC